MYLSLTIQSVFSKGTEIDKDKQKDGIVSILFDLPLIENAKELLRLNISVSHTRICLCLCICLSLQGNEMKMRRSCSVSISQYLSQSAETLLALAPLSRS